MVVVETLQAHRDSRHTGDDTETLDTQEMTQRLYRHTGDDLIVGGTREVQKGRLKGS